MTEPIVFVIALPSSSLSGGLMVTSLVVTAQPATGVVRTELKGWSVGRLTVDAMVPAVSSSSGTRNVTTP